MYGRIRARAEYDSPKNPGGDEKVGQDPLGGRAPVAFSKLWTAKPICLRLFTHLVRAAASRTFWTAGKSRPISTAMIAMTTSSSMSVKARTRLVDVSILYTTYL